MFHHNRTETKEKRQFFGRFRFRRQWQKGDCQQSRKCQIPSQSYLPNPNKSRLSHQKKTNPEKIVKVKRDKKTHLKKKGTISNTQMCFMYQVTRNYKERPNNQVKLKRDLQ